jgi:dTMP kinase
MEQPMFITFEGIDSSGKTTQAKLLQSYLRKHGMKTILIREPGGTRISEKIRDILLDHKLHEMTTLTEFLLFSASRSQLVSDIIKSNLKRKVVVICDRFYDSSTAYQGHAGKLDLNKVRIINHFATGGVKPDVTFFIDVSPHTALARSRGKNLDRIERKNLSFYNKVRRGFLQIANNQPRRFFVINGNHTIKEVHHDILKVLNKKYQSLK